MSKLTVSLTVTYDFSGELLKQYLEQLDDHEDTLSQRKWFAVDRFIGHDNLVLFDKHAHLNVEVISPEAECACPNCSETELYSRLYCQNCFDSGCGK